MLARVWHLIRDSIIWLESDPPIVLKNNRLPPEGRSWFSRNAEKIMRHRSHCLHNFIPELQQGAKHEVIARARSDLERDMRTTLPSLAEHHRSALPLPPVHRVFHITPTDDVPAPPVMFRRLRRQRDRPIDNTTASRPPPR